MATEAEIHAALTTIFNDVFLRDDMILTAELSAKDVQGWDSFKQIEIIMASEEHWKIRFTTRELDALRCVGDLVRTIASKTV
ncbi:MAG: acyl carrier protein [Acetobacteraceae bacterium]|nr:acyl carrier protein [Acetobacteraceae bacterium]